MSKSKIEWTDDTWNPVTGCAPISDGCKNCYAKKMAHRLKAMGNKNYALGFEVACHPNMLETSFGKKPKKIFVCSMGDLFHENVHDLFIQGVFKVMNDNPQHIFQVLTKRPERGIDLIGKIRWTENIWFGATMENMKTTGRAYTLGSVPSKIKFLSLEPLLSRIPKYFNCFYDIDWVIAGGESGHGARPMDIDWVRGVRDQCVENDVPFFFKGYGKKSLGNELDGVVWQQYPKIMNRG